MATGTLLFLLGCVDGETVEGCGLDTTIPGWEPACSAVLIEYETDALVVVDDRLEAWLPQPLEDETYGGQTGNDLTLLFDGDLATGRVSTVTLADGGATVRIDATFDAGTVSGVVFPAREQGR